MSDGKQEIEARKRVLIEGLCKIILHGLDFTGLNPNDKKEVNHNDPPASGSESSTKDDEKS
jgi:hypothetical protein